MQIGGLVKLSLVDYPGKPSAVIFTQGCNFRCSYCHNRELVIPACFQSTIPQHEIMRFLEKRQGFLSGVVVSGGEPTLQKGLLDFLQTVKCLGYSVKLDTNGSRPDVLKAAIAEKLVDFVAMDVKAPLESYSKIAGVSVDSTLIEQSIGIIRDSGVDYQFRTTLVRPLLGFDDIPKLFSLVHGVKSYVLQNFRPCESILDPVLLSCGPFEHNEFLNLQEKWEIKAG